MCPACCLAHSLKRPRHTDCQLVQPACTPLRDILQFVGVDSTGLFPAMHNHSVTGLCGVVVWWDQACWGHGLPQRHVFCALTQVLLHGCGVASAVLAAVWSVVHMPAAAGLLLQRQRALGAQVYGLCAVAQAWLCGLALSAQSASLRPRGNRQAGDLTTCVRRAELLLLCGHLCGFIASGRCMCG